MSTTSAIRQHPIRAIVGAAIVVIVAAFLVIYFGLFAHSSPKKLVLTSNGQPDLLAASQLPGTWTVASGSVVGYRVREQLGSLPAPDDAVGRTSQVTGTLTVTSDGGSDKATGANFSADVATLTSDQARRDKYIKHGGLQSNEYPTATFAQTGSITVPSAAVSGKPAQVSVTGHLTIHGVTKLVTIPLQVQISGRELQVVGSLQFPFSEFGMTPPSIGSFVSVQNNATLEFSLLFARA